MITQTNRRSTAFCVLGVSLLLGLSTHAALPSLSDDTEENWGPGKFSVIAAKVRDAERLPDYSWKAVLIPRATITGTFDPGLHSELPVTFNAESTGTTSIRRAPKAGDTVIAVIYSSGNAWSVTIHLCSFMPDGSSMMIVDGLDDPRVAQTLKNIQTSRAKGLAKIKRKAEGRKELHKEALTD